MLVSAFIFGFLMDTYYLGFFGIYIVSLMMIVYIADILKDVLKPNILTYVMLTVIEVTILENFIYGVIRILGLTRISFQEFLVTRLAATLLLNSVIMFLIGYFIQRLIYQVEDKN